MKTRMENKDVCYRRKEGGGGAGRKKEGGKEDEGKGEMGDVGGKVSEAWKRERKRRYGDSELKMKYGKIMVNEVREGEGKEGRREGGRERRKDEGDDGT